jgi:internalin A
MIVMDPELLEVIRKAGEDLATVLDLEGRGLQELPPQVFALTNLEKLNLNDNNLTSLPPEICQLHNLTDLYVRRNKIQGLSGAIAHLTQLERLHLGDNQLAELPGEISDLTRLVSLDLKNNQLQELPPGIAKLKELKKLDLRGNPLLSIPPEILGDTWENLGEPSVLVNYWSQLQGSHPLNEAKMIIVGQGSVGKTSLVKRLTENRYDPHEPKTEGINIQNWKIQVNNSSIRLNIWDFGGQEIMHATHQFFLTKRSLYLLVVNARTDEESRLEYWLKLIQSYGDDSPVIIVGNKIDEQPLDINESGLRQKYPNIQAVVGISCKDESGLENLKNLINQSVEKLEHVDDSIPRSWFVVKNQLELIQEDYIPYSDFERICREQRILESISQDTLIELLHKLGIVLSFRDDEKLAGMGVLNPEWVTSGVYKIINDNLLMTEHRGVMKNSQLNRILGDDRYPSDKKIFIRNMMERFELCFLLPDDNGVLIPDLLPKGEPSTGNWDNALEFQYHYDILPSSIISRFIVRMHVYAEKRTWWRSGILLRYGENRALIKADREEKQIFIQICGPISTRRDLLQIIRQELNEIHRSIRGLTARAKVPIPGYLGTWADYEHLLSLEKKGILSWIPEGTTEEFNVRDLLYGSELKSSFPTLNSTSLSSTGNVIYNQFNQVNHMSEIKLNHSGSGDNIVGTKITNNNPSPNLSQAAADIKQLLDNLSNDYPDDSLNMIGAKAADKITDNPTLRSRVLSAITEASTTALEEAVDHPAIAILVAGIKGFKES